jgi:hypothetical protein
VIYFICSRKSQNLNATVTAVHGNNIEVGITGPLKEPDQISAFNMEDIYSSEVKIDNTSPMIAVYGNDIEVSISRALKEPDQTSAFNMEDIYSSEAKIDNTSPLIAVHGNDIEVGISRALKEPDQTSAFNMEDIYSSEAKIDFIPPPRPWVSDWDIYSSEANCEYVIGKNKRMRAKNEQIRLAKQGKSDNITRNIPPPPPWVSGR